MRAMVLKIQQHFKNEIFWGACPTSFVLVPYSWRLLILRSPDSKVAYSQKMKKIQKVFSTGEKVWASPQNFRFFSPSLERQNLIFSKSEINHLNVIFLFQDHAYYSRQRLSHSSGGHASRAKTQEVVGSAGCWDFFLFLFLSTGSLIKSLMEVQHNWFPYNKWMLSYAVWAELAKNANCLSLLMRPIFGSAVSPFLFLCVQALNILSPENSLEVAGIKPMTFGLWADCKLPDHRYCLNPLNVQICVSLKCFSPAKVEASNGTTTSSRSQ